MTPKRAVLIWFATEARNHEIFKLYLTFYSCFRRLFFKAYELRHRALKTRSRRSLNTLKYWDFHAIYEVNISKWKSCCCLNLYQFITKVGYFLCVLSSSMRRKELVSLTLTLLTWIIGWAPNNANKWQMGFNLAFKGLIWNHFLWE
jgi:AAA+ ATPase superfamily predicted ATPase